MGRSRIGSGQVEKKESDSSSDRTISPRRSQDGHRLSSHGSGEAILQAGSHRSSAELLRPPHRSLAGPGLRIAAAVIIYSALLKPGGGFRSDVILVALLLLVPPVVQLIGGHSARDPLAQVGARKEGRTIVAYELGSLLAVVATLVHAGAVSFAQLQAWREAHYPIVASLAGLLASIALIYCSQDIIGLSSYLIELAGLE